MEAMREAWTDARLDDLNHKVDEGFRRMDARFESMQAHLDKRLNAMIISNGTIVAALIGLIATQL
jgi:hypothetical protein